MRALYMPGAMFIVIEGSFKETEIRLVVHCNSMLSRSLTPLLKRVPLNRESCDICWPRVEIWEKRETPFGSEELEDTVNEPVAMFATTSLGKKFTFTEGLLWYWVAS